MARKKKDLEDRVELDPRVCNGKPVISGTRIPVSVILEKVASGKSWKSLLSDYPELELEDIRAALLFARAAIDNAELKASGV